MKPRWPVLIVETRYSGVYEGGEWAAFSGLVEVPAGAIGDDVECGEWWAEHGHEVGVGATPNEAYEDLGRKLRVLESQR